MHADIEAMERASRWKMRGAMFVFGWLAHFMGSALILARQTVCAWPPCVDSWIFTAIRGAWLAPVFLTPWAEFPAVEDELIRSWPLIGLLALNAALATACVALLWFVAKCARAWHKTRHAP